LPPGAANPPWPKRHFREALRLGRDDVYLLAAWGDFLLDAGRPQDVLRRWPAGIASDSLLLRLAEAEASLKAAKAARLGADAGRSLCRCPKRAATTTHMAEEARYQLRLRGDAKEALRLAVENYRVQREPRDARILLEAAIAAGDAAAAQAGARLAADQRLRGCAIAGLGAGVGAGDTAMMLRWLLRGCVLLLALPALAHKASDSYLMLDVQGRKCRAMGHRPARHRFRARP
jgi:hypothetical protein